MEKFVSVVISARDEMPNIVHTVHSIANDLETFLTNDAWEIIIVDNGSKNPDSWRFLAERGMYYHRNIRVLHDPLMGNVTARNKGAKIAKGKYLFFSDAHMSYRIGSFERAIKAIQETGGIVHGAVQWMGGHDPSSPSFQYSIKIGEKLWGTWNMARIGFDNYFYIAGSGHCFLGVERQQFLDFGGYNDWFRCYGGGELYLAFKWWMMGAPVVCEPRAVGYHLSAGRGYNYHNNDLIHNMMLLGFAIGADALAERIYIRYMEKPGIHRDILDELYADAQKEAESDREMFRLKQAKSFYDVLKDRPWDSKNLEQFGEKQSFVTVYDHTWINELPAESKSFYDASPLQKELRAYIDEHLADAVYGKQKTAHQ